MATASPMRMVCGLFLEKQALVQAGTLTQAFQLFLLHLRATPDLS